MCAATVNLRPEVRIRHEEGLFQVVAATGNTSSSCCKKGAAALMRLQRQECSSLEYERETFFNFTCCEKKIILLFANKKRDVITSYKIIWLHFIYHSLVLEYILFYNGYNSLGIKNI